MLSERDGTPMAFGYFVLYRDDDGNGRLTRARGKPNEWPEFIGLVNRHVTVYCQSDVLAGTRLAERLGGALRAGMHLLSVELTADCDETSCRGHDRTTPTVEPPRLEVLVDRPFRFPNVT